MQLQQAYALKNADGTGSAKVARMALKQRAHVVASASYKTHMVPKLLHTRVMVALHLKVAVVLQYRLLRHYRGGSVPRRSGWSRPALRPQKARPSSRPWGLDQIVLYRPFRRS